MVLLICPQFWLKEDGFPPSLFSFQLIEVFMSFFELEGGSLLPPPSRMIPVSDFGQCGYGDDFLLLCGIAVSGGFCISR